MPTGDGRVMKRDGSLRCNRTSGRRCARISRFVSAPRPLCVRLIFTIVCAIDSRMSPAKRKTAAAVTGRGSPEAVAKRRVARKLNQLFAESGNGVRSRDGRREKRRQRLLADLEKATRKGGSGIKPIELLQRVSALIELGETPSAIRKVVRGAAVRRFPGETAEVLREVHKAYQFPVAAYRFLGLPHDVLVAAQVISADAPRRGRPPKQSALVRTPKKRVAAKSHR